MDIDSPEIGGMFDAEPDLDFVFMPRSRTKESHINKDRRYEVDEISTNSSTNPSTVIPKEYWDDLMERTKDY